MEPAKGAGRETGAGRDRMLPWQSGFRVSLGTGYLRAMGAV